MLCAGAAWVSVVVPGHPLATAIALLPLASHPVVVILQFISFCLSQCSAAKKVCIHLLEHLLQ